METHPPPPSQRRIMHVDMDAFYASVEQLDHPEFRGKPLVVGGNGPRSVVAAASYEVRKFGVRSAMPMAEALRRCPQLICATPRMQRYREVSHQIFALFRETTPLVEGLSLDEAYLDVTGQTRDMRQLLAMGLAIKRGIRQRVGLTASVGMGPNKLVAKIASDLDKPDGLLLVRPEEVQAVLDPLPARSINGIGPRSSEALARLGICTIRDLRLAPLTHITPIFGRFSRRMQQRACGVDERPVEPHGELKSVSAEETFDQDLIELESLRTQLAQLAERTTRRLHARKLCAGTVWVKIRDNAFRTVTRQHSFSHATDRLEHVRAAAVSLLETWHAGHPGVAVRLLGVGLSGLEPAHQLELFGDGEPAHGKPLESLIDEVRGRFGPHALGRGHPGRRLRER